MVATTGEGSDDIGTETVLDDQAAGIGKAGVKRGRQALGVPRGRVDCFLERHPGTEVAQNKYQLPLVLLVAAGSAAGENGRTVAHHKGRGKGRPGTPARHERGGEALLEPGHLQASAETKTELGDRRRTLQPSPARCCGDHVAPAVHDVDMDRVATGKPRGSHRRIATVAVEVRAEARAAQAGRFDFEDLSRLACDARTAAIRLTRT